MALAAALLVGGCVTSSIEQLRHGRSAIVIAPDQSVVVLGRLHQSGYRTEGDFTQCVVDGLADADIPVYDRQRFRDRLFPWFEPRTAPLAIDALPALLEDPAVTARLEATGVRYLVWLDGATKNVGGGGSMGCAVGPGGGGCLGFVWWEDAAEYEAAVWDLHRLRSVARVNLEANGTSYMPALILPVPLLARTQNAACDGIVARLREMLAPAATGPGSVASPTASQTPGPRREPGRSAAAGRSQ